MTIKKKKKSARRIYISEAAYKELLKRADAESRKIIQVVDVLLKV